MSTLNIGIRVDPQDSAAKTDAVTTALHKAEDQGVRTQKAFTDVDKKLEAMVRAELEAERQTKEFMEAQRGLAVMTVSLGDATQKTSNHIGKMLAESAKGQAMQRLHGIAMELGDALNEASGGAVNMGDAMIGLQIAGPVGAVIGGLGGEIKKLSGDLPGANELLEEHRSRQLHAAESARDAMKAIEAEGAKLLDLVANMSPINTAMHDMASGFRDVADAAKSVPDWLVRGLGGDAWDPAALKKKLDNINAGGAYIGGLGDLGRNGAGGRGLDSAILAGQMNQAVPGAKQWFDDTEVKGLTAALAEQLEIEIAAAQALEDYANGWRSLADSDAKQAGADLNRMLEEGKHAAEDLADAMRRAADERERAQKTHVEKMAAEEKRSIDEIVAHMRPVEDAFEELFRTGSFGWKKMVDSMVTDLSRLATHSLFTSLVSSIHGTPWQDAQAAAEHAASGGAHAFGGSYTVPSTGGGQDSVTTMFRLSPGERVDFTPPGGAPQGQAAAAAPTNVQVHVVDQRDQRGLLRSPDDVIRVVLDDMGKNPGKYRSLLPTR